MCRNLVDHIRVGFINAMWIEHFSHLLKKIFKVRTKHAGTPILRSSSIHTYDLIIYDSSVIILLDNKKYEEKERMSHCFFRTQTPTKRNRK